MHISSLFHGNIYGNCRDGGTHEKDKGVLF